MLPFLFNFFEFKGNYHIRIKANKDVRMRIQCYYYFDFVKIRARGARTTKN